MVNKESGQKYFSTHVAIEFHLVHKVEYHKIEFML